MAAITLAMLELVGMSYDEFRRWLGMALVALVVNLIVESIRLILK